VRTIRVLLVDDRLIRREKLRALLSAEIDLEMVGEAGDGLEAARLTQQLLPDVAVVDVVRVIRDAVKQRSSLNSAISRRVLS
jgi:DNA-binding NarL/FixJ family response regulator